jgi:tetratricopeptide (TPR) repeat protein
MKAALFSSLIFLLSLAEFSSAEVDLNFILNPCNVPPGSPDPRLKIAKCLATIDKVKPQQRGAIYQQISSAYMDLKDYDQAINFWEKATLNYEVSSDGRSPTAEGQRAYRRSLAWFYRHLASLEELKAMSLHVEWRDPQQARLFAARAMRSVSKSIWLNPYYHESYAIRGSVEAHSCKPNEARTDIQEAIELASRSGEKEAAEKYASIDPNDCWWGEKDR